MKTEIFRKVSQQAFEEGRAAFLAGKGDDSCPYVGRGSIPNQSDDRLDWMNGFYQAKYGDKWEAK